MSASLSEERDRIQRQVERLEQSLSVADADLQLLSSDSDDESESDDTEDVSSADLLAQREKIQKEIQNLENVLGPHSPVSVSDDDSSSSGDESELGLPQSMESCLQMNLVYQQVLQEALDHLETLMTHNQRQQKELMTRLSGPIKEAPKKQTTSTSYQQPVHMYLGRFLKPYFKDKLTGLGPPANQEAKDKASKVSGNQDDQRMKMKRWESWHKELILHSVAKDTMTKLIQPKLSRVDFLTQKLKKMQEETEKQQIRDQMDSLEKEIEQIKGKKKEELHGERFEEHDWQKISNIDFEGTREANDIRCFWQNFLHPSINKSTWSPEEVQKLRKISSKYGEKNWDTIAEELGTGRTAFMCLQMFQRFVSQSLKRKCWTAAEDEVLRELVDKMRIGNFIPYTQMSYFMEGRGPAQLIYRWNHVLHPSLKRGPWTKAEDRLLLQAVARNGEKNWWKIRLAVPGRTDSACRDRYLDCLKAGTKRGEFDEHERKLLVRLVEKYGVGRWAKIASEIPHRIDSQCMRQWKRISKKMQSQNEKQRPATKASRTQGEHMTETKNVSSANRRIRKRQIDIKEEVITEESSEEDDEEVVEYMDSSDDNDEVEETTVTEEVKEEEYVIPPMKEWIPLHEDKQDAHLSFQPVVLPTLCDNGEQVRSTIEGKSGRSVFVGPHPRKLTREEHRTDSMIMMMVTFDQLQAHFRPQRAKSKIQRPHCQGKSKDVKNKPRQMTRSELSCHLQAAVLPWIGNLLIPGKKTLTVADTLGQRAEKTTISTTSVFMLLLQTMKVDTVGCREMIEQRNISSGPRLTVAGIMRRKSIVSLLDTVPQFVQRNQPLLIQNVQPQLPTMNLNTSYTHTPQTVAGIIRQKSPWGLPQTVPQLKQHNLLLVQHSAKGRTRHHKIPRQLLPLPPSVPPFMSSPTNPGVLQMFPRWDPQMAHVPFPQALFVPNPLLHPQQPNASTTQNLTPYFQNAFPFPPRTPPTYQTPTSAPLVMVPTDHSKIPTRSIAVLPQARPFPPTQKVVSSTILNGDFPVSSSLTVQPTISTYSPQPSPSPRLPRSKANPPRTGGKKKEEEVNSPTKLDISEDNYNINSTCTVEIGDGVTEEGQRIRKPSQKAKALQEAIKAKLKIQRKAKAREVKAKKKTPHPPEQLDTASNQQEEHAVTSTVITPPTPQQKPDSAEVISPSSPYSPSLTHTEAASLASPPAVETVPPPAILNVPVISVDKPQTSTAPLHGEASSNLKLSFSPSNSMPGTEKGVSSTSNHLHAFSSEHERSALIQRDHDYAIQSHPSNSQLTLISKKPKVSETLQEAFLENSPKGSKREREEEQDGDIQSGKRIRKLSLKARELQIANEIKAEVKNKKATRRGTRHGTPEKGGVQQSETQSPKIFYPNQPMYAMTPRGLIPLANPLVRGPQLTMIPNTNTPIPPVAPVSILTHPPVTPHPQFTAGAQGPFEPCAGTIPLNCIYPNQPHPPPVHLFNPLPQPFVLQTVQNPGLPHSPPTTPPFRREPLQFDPSLMFLEPKEEVQEWLSGKKGVVVPGLHVALPYLPPFVSNLTTLAALLRAKQSLTKSALQLIEQGSKDQQPQTDSRTVNGTEKESSRLVLDLSDSTISDRSAASDQAAATSDRPGLPLGKEEEDEEEEELVAAVRRMVTERFSGNPAYQMLKARFLSCFTVPAMLATVQPNTHSYEEVKQEVDGELEVKKMKEKCKQRRAEKSLLLGDDESGHPASHFSGISNTNTPTTEQSNGTQDHTVQ